jgi:hypothetical protein
VREHNADDKERGVLTTGRIHLNAAGNGSVADRILQCLGE